MSSQTVKLFWRVMGKAASCFRRQKQIEQVSKDTLDDVFEIDNSYSEHPTKGGFDIQEATDHLRAQINLAQDKLELSYSEL